MNQVWVLEKNDIKICVKGTENLYSIFKISETDSNVKICIAENLELELAIWIIQQKQNHDKQQNEKVNPDELKDTVFSDISSNLELSDNPEKAIEIIRNLTKAQAFAKWCYWNGLIGSQHRYIREALESIYGVSLP